MSKGKISISILVGLVTAVVAAIVILAVWEAGLPIDNVVAE